MALHRDISINTLCLAPAPFDEQVSTIARLGARGISPGHEQIGEGAPQIGEPGHLAADGLLVNAELVLLKGDRRRTDVAADLA